MWSVTLMTQTLNPKGTESLLSREIHFVAKLEVHNVSQSRKTIQLKLCTWAENSTNSA